VRLVAQKLADSLGQPFLVEESRRRRRQYRHRLRREERARTATPCFRVGPGSLIINPLMGQGSYDTERDFRADHADGEGATRSSRHPSLPRNPVKELIALARSRPGESTTARAGAAARRTSLRRCSPADAGVTLHARSTKERHPRPQT